MSGAGGRTGGSESEPIAARPLTFAFMVGAARVDLISDGASMEALGRLFGGIAPDRWTAALGVPDAATPVGFNYGAVLVRADLRTILIDTGYGYLRRQPGMPGSGELPDRLDELGVSADAIDTVVHTHMHSDHCGWNVDERSQPRLLLPNARTIVAEQEVRHWFSDAVDRHPSRDYIRSRMAPLIEAGMVETTGGDHQVSPSVRTLSTPGHTPGHCSVLVESAGQTLLVLGDVAHLPIHLEHHDWLPGVDFDPDSSRRSRAMVADLAARNGWLITGGHFVIPTLGTLESSGSGYRWRLASVSPIASGEDGFRTGQSGTS